MGRIKKEKDLAKTVNYLNFSSVWVSHFKLHGAFTQLGKKEMEI